MVVGTVLNFRLSDHRRLSGEFCGAFGRGVSLRQRFAQRRICFSARNRMINILTRQLWCVYNSVCLSLFVFDYQLRDIDDTAEAPAGSTSNVNGSGFKLDSCRCSTADDLAPVTL